jgi:hypothetical protein
MSACFFNVQRLHTLTRKVDMFLICKDITKKRNAEKSASLPPFLSINSERKRKGNKNHPISFSRDVFDFFLFE